MYTGRCRNKIRNNMSSAILALTLVTPIKIREILPFTLQHDTENAMQPS